MGCLSIDVVSLTLKKIIIIKKLVLDRFDLRGCTHGEQEAFRLSKISAHWHVGKLMSERYVLVTFVDSDVFAAKVCSLSP